MTSAILPSIHIVAQIANLLNLAGEGLAAGRELTSKNLEALAKELERALPSSLDDWLRNQLDTELAALERELGVTVTDAFHQTGRPKVLARIERMIHPLVLPPGKVVLAGNSRATETGTSESLAVDFPSRGLAVVTEGSTRVVIRGERQVRVFRIVVDACGMPVSWAEMLQADMRRATEMK